MVTTQKREIVFSWIRCPLLAVVTQIVATSSEGLLCGFYAISKSIEHQVPSCPIPTVAQLRAAMDLEEIAMANSIVGLTKLTTLLWTNWPSYFIVGESNKILTWSL